MGNRGILHNCDQSLGRARWRHKAWVTCALEFKDRRRKVMQPGNYTELFFLDEAVALAAGHRPCARCRRPNFQAYLTALNHKGSAKELDTALHAARVIPRTTSHRRYRADIATLPFGTIVNFGTPHLVTTRHLLPISAAGYGPAHPRPASGKITVLTPALSVQALDAGYRPHLHPTAEVSIQRSSGSTFITNTRSWRKTPPGNRN